MDDSTFSADISSLTTNSSWSFESQDVSYAVEPLPSLVYDLLKSNEAPIHSHLLQSNLHEAESVLSDLDKRLERMKAEVQRYASEREQLVDMIHSYRNVLHPIRRTPPEVLLEIFAYCVETVDPERREDCEKLNSLDTKEAPWSFGQVCIHWRSVVLGCPSLWNSLSLNLTKFNHEDALVAQQLEANAIVLLSHYLKRSKDCSLTIAIHSSQPMHSLISMICGESRRWQNVLLSLPAEGFRFLTSIQGCLPKLSYLHLRSWSVPEVWAITPSIDAFKYSPNLVEFRSHGIPRITTTVLLPWQQLTDCSNHYSPIYTAVSPTFRDSVNETNISILDKGFQLRSVMFHCAGLMVTAIPLQRHAFLTCLSLDLARRTNYDLLTRFLDSLILPSLRYLRIDMTSKLRPRPKVQAVVSLLQRSECSLVKLRLKGFDTDVDDQGSPFASLLDLIGDTMQNLCLECLSNSLLTALLVPDRHPHHSHSHSSPPRLHRLRQLRISGTCPPDLDEMLLVRMLESRVNHMRFFSFAKSSSFVMSNLEAERQLGELKNRRMNTRLGNKVSVASLQSTNN